MSDKSTIVSINLCAAFTTEFNSCLLASLTKIGTSISLLVLSSRYNIFTFACFVPKEVNPSFFTTVNLVFTGNILLLTLFIISLSFNMSPIITETGFLSTSFGKNVLLNVPFSGFTIFKLLILFTFTTFPSIFCLVPKLKSVLLFILLSK